MKTLNSINNNTSVNQFFPFNDSGFSLLEVLVALLVLSVGLLGIAGLQTFSLQFNHQSYERTQATLLISDIAERIITNPLAARAGRYDGVLDTSLASSYTGYGGCPASCGTTNELATYDIFMWKSALENSKVLAQGTGSITRVIDAADADAVIHDIRVQWVENNLPASQTMRIRTL